MQSRLSASLARITEIEWRLRALGGSNAPLDSGPCPPRMRASRSCRSSPGDFDALVQRAAARYRLDPALIHAVIRAESDYNPRAVSRAGARGLMQIMPDTARAFGVKDAFDPVQNIEAGARELRGYLDRFDSVELALAAYNAGPGNVRKYGGIPPFRETQAYIPRVLEYWRQEQNRVQRP